MSKATIGEAIAAAAQRLADAGIETARLDAEVLAAHSLGMERLDMLGGLTSDMPQDAAKLFTAYTARRINREPIAYITSVKEFWSLELSTPSGVLIPRPDSELLVEAVLNESKKLFEGYERPLRLLDLGVGSGCLLLSLLKNIDNAVGLGIDISGRAIEVAQLNAKYLGLEQRVSFYQGRWWQPLINNPSKFDIIISNPPYIRSGDIAGLEPEITQFEPLRALDGGADGLEAYRVIMGGIVGFLAPRALVAFEIGYDQGEAITALMKPFFNDLPRRLQDISGRDRVLLATRGVGGTGL